MYHYSLQSYRMTPAGLEILLSGPGRFVSLYCIVATCSLGVGFVLLPWKTVVLTTPCVLVAAVVPALFLNMNLGEADLKLKDGQLWLTARDWSRWVPGWARRHLGAVGQPELRSCFEWHPDFGFYWSRELKLGPVVLGGKASGLQGTAYEAELQAALDEMTRQNCPRPDASRALAAFREIDSQLSQSLSDETLFGLMGLLPAARRRGLVLDGLADQCRMVTRWTRETA